MVLEEWAERDTNAEVSNWMHALVMPAAPRRSVKVILWRDGPKGISNVAIRKEIECVSVREKERERETRKAKDFIWALSFVFLLIKHRLLTMIMDVKKLCVCVHTKICAHTEQPPQHWTRQHKQRSKTERGGWMFYLNLKLSTILCSNDMANGIKRSSWRDMILPGPTQERKWNKESKKKV